MSTTPNSPMVCAKLRAVPVMSPGMESGAMTRINVRNGDDPKVAEAASNLPSMLENELAKGWTAKGRLYRTDPITRPLKVNASVCPVRETHQRPKGLR